MSELSLEPMTQGEEIRVLRLALADARACSRELGDEINRLRAEVAECKELLRVIMEVPPLNATPKWVARRCNAYDRARAILAEE